MNKKRFLKTTCKALRFMGYDCVVRQSDKLTVFSDPKGLLLNVNVHFDRLLPGEEIYTLMVVSPTREASCSERFQSNNFPRMLTIVNEFLQDFTPKFK